MTNNLLVELRLSTDIRTIIIKRAKFQLLVKNSRLTQHFIAVNGGLNH